MSQALLSRPSRPSTSRLVAGRDSASGRADAETILRDVAFVLRLTQRVRADITDKQEVAERQPG